MSKLIDINQYLTLKNYAKKYGVCGRKLYRHRHDEEIDFINIDGKYFIKDERSIKLETNNSGRPPSKSVKKLTDKEKSVTNLTFKPSKSVTNLTLNTDNVTNSGLNEDSKNVKKLTLSNPDTVKNLTFNKRLDELLSIPEDERSIKDFEEIDKLMNES